MGSSRWRVRTGCAAAAVPCVASVVVCGELSPGALLGVGLTGLAVAGVALARRAGEAAPPAGRAVLPWLGWLAAVAVWEAVTLADPGLPTLSDLLDPVLAHPAVRGAAALGWLAAGAWLLARPRHRPGHPR